LSIFDAVIPAKLLRLVCATAAVRARVRHRTAARSVAPRRFRAGDGAQKLAAGACVRKRRRRWRFAGAVHDANGLAGRVEIAQGVMDCGGKRHAAFVRAMALKSSRLRRACESAVVLAIVYTPCSSRHADVDLPDGVWHFGWSINLPDSVGQMFSAGWDK
jgi:hypothetical protein